MEDFIRKAIATVGVIAFFTLILSLFCMAIVIGLHMMGIIATTTIISKIAGVTIISGATFILALLADSFREVIV